MSGVTFRFTPGLYEWDGEDWKPVPEGAQLEPLAAPLPGENLAHVLDAAENSLYRAKQLRGHAQAMEEDGAKAWAERLRKAADELDRRTRYAVMEALGPDAVGVESTSTFDDVPDEAVAEALAGRHTLRGVSLDEPAERVSQAWRGGVVTILLDGHPVGQPRRGSDGKWRLMIEDLYAPSYGEHEHLLDLHGAVQRVGHLEHTPPSIPVKPEWGDGPVPDRDDGPEHFAKTPPVPDGYCWVEHHPEAAGKPWRYTFHDQRKLVRGVIVQTNEGRWRLEDGEGVPFFGHDGVAEYNVLAEAKLAVQRAVVGFATHAEAEAGAEPDADKTPGVDAPVFATTADDFYGRSPEAMSTRIAELEAQVAECSNILAERFAPIEITRFRGKELVGTAYVGLPASEGSADSERPWRFDTGPAYRKLREQTIGVPYKSLESLFTHVAKCLGVEKHKLLLDNGRGEDA